MPNLMPQLYTFCAKLGIDDETWYCNVMAWTEEEARAKAEKAFEATVGRKLKEKRGSGKCVNLT